MLAVLLMFFAALLALLWANSPWQASYFQLWQYPIGLSLHDWINEGLMAVFFFLVGMEIKRELHEKLYCL